MKKWRNRYYKEQYNGCIFWDEQDDYVCNGDIVNSAYILLKGLEDNESQNR